MNNTTVYIRYVKAVLAGLDRSSCKAAYDTGFGLSITSEAMGDVCDTLSVVQHRVARILPPNDAIEGDEWFAAWDAGKAIVRAFVGTAFTSEDFGVRADE